MLLPILPTPPMGVASTRSRAFFGISFLFRAPLRPVMGLAPVAALAPLPPLSLPPSIRVREYVTT
jgi:hypothetical protein